MSASRCTTSQLTPRFVGTSMPQPSLHTLPALLVRVDSYLVCLISAWVCVRVWDSHFYGCGLCALLAGDETIEEVEEEATADEIAAASSARHGSKVPYLVRNLSDTVSATGSEAGGASAGPARQSDLLTATWGDSGALRFTGGTETFSGKAAEQPAAKFV